MGLMNSAQDSLMCIVHGRKVNNCAKKKKKKKGNMMYKTQCAISQFQMGTVSKQSLSLSDGQNILTYLMAIIKYYYYTTQDATYAKIKKNIYKNKK